MKVRLVLLWLPLSTCLFAADPSATRQSTVAKQAESMREELISRRRDFHEHPELSNREERTSKIVAEELKKIGFTDVRTGVGKYGVLATLKGGKPGPVVAVRADMDALPIQEVNDVPYKSTVPNVKHACGHDAHTTIGLGVAKVLYGMRDQLSGTVKFVFQPAEEGPPLGEEGGAPLMIKEGALDAPRPQVIFGLHVTPLADVGKIWYTPGGTMASSDSFKILVKGKQSHGAYPHLGIDPIVVSANIIQELQTIPSRRIRALDPIVITIGKINGGVRMNVVADEVVMEGTLRTLSEEVRAKAQPLMEKIVTQVAAANEASATLEWNPRNNPVTYNDPALAQEMVPIMRKIAGADNVVLADPQMGSEDFAHFQKVIPGFYYFIGVANKSRGMTAMVHTPDFDLDEQALVNGVNMMSNIVLDYLDRHAKDAPKVATGK